MKLKHQHTVTYQIVFVVGTIFNAVNIRREMSKELVAKVPNSNLLVINFRIELLFVAITAVTLRRHRVVITNQPLTRSCLVIYSTHTNEIVKTMRNISGS